MHQTTALRTYDPILTTLMLACVHNQREMILAGIMPSMCDGLAFVAGSDLSENPKAIRSNSHEWTFVNKNKHLTFLKKWQKGKWKERKYSFERSHFLCLRDDWNPHRSNSLPSVTVTALNRLLGGWRQHDFLLTVPNSSTCAAHYILFVPGIFFSLHFFGFDSKMCWGCLP